MRLHPRIQRSLPLAYNTACPSHTTQPAPRIQPDTAHGACIPGIQPTLRRTRAHAHSLARRLACTSAHHPLAGGSDVGARRTPFARLRAVAPCAARRAVPPLHPAADAPGTISRAYHFALGVGMVGNAALRAAPLVERDLSALDVDDCMRAGLAREVRADAARRRACYLPTLRGTRRRGQLGVRTALAIPFAHVGGQVLVVVLTSDKAKQSSHMRSAEPSSTTAYSAAYRVLTAAQRRPSVRPCRYRGVRSSFLRCGSPMGQPGPWSRCGHVCLRSSSTSLCAHPAAELAGPSPCDAPSPPTLPCA
jgi:hypothetical protein